MENRVHLSIERLARRRIANQAAYYAAKKERARTAPERTSAAWDQWRGLLRELPAEQAAQWADALTSTLDNHIARITQILESEGERNARSR
jgi:hypothetical protein